MLKLAWCRGTALGRRFNSRCQVDGVSVTFLHRA